MSDGPPSPLTSGKFLLVWSLVTLTVAGLTTFTAFKVRDRTDSDYQRLRGVVETESEARREAQAHSRDMAQQVLTERAACEEAQNRLATETAAHKESQKKIRDLEQRVEADRLAKTAAEKLARRETSLRQEGEERNRTTEQTQATGTPAPQDETSTKSPVVKRSADPLAEPETTQASRSANKRESFDLGDIIATAEWARLNDNELEVSFSFTNKTKSTLWIVPASQDTAQATDDVKNSYKWIGATGFRRRTERLWPEPRMLANDFLQLDPNVSAPGSFSFRRHSRSAAHGASKIRFFTGLTIIRDFKARSAYDRTVTAEINLD